MTTVAVIGGGQLARMMAAPATALGVTLRVLVESPVASAALAAHESVVGMPADEQAIRALLAEPRPAALTWEHEHIPERVFEIAAEVGVPARPGLGALGFAQDKIAMRQRMDELGLPNPAWAPVETVADVASFLQASGGTAILKTARGGYDGKGVMVVTEAEQAQPWLEAAAEGGPRVLIEAKVPFVRELALQVARRPSGEIAEYVLVESIQRDGVCSEVISPAPNLSDTTRRDAARMGEVLATKLGVTGMLAIELFEVEGGALLINELAMRPHNSGHWSIDGAVTSQFEQHLRAVLDWPLGDPAPHPGVTVMANILGGAREDLVGALAGVKDPGVKVHLYGKDVRPGRKVGHVTVTAASESDARQRAAAVAAWIRDGDGE